MFRLPLGEVKALALERLNHLWFLALGMGNRGSVNSLFKLEQFGGFCNLLDRTSQFWVWIAFVGLFTRSAIPAVFIPVCEEGWFHSDRKMEQTCFNSHSLKAFRALGLAGDLPAG